MRPVGTRLVVLAALTAPLWLSLGPARADCAAPTLRVVPREARVEDVITVVGEFWTDTCDDVGGTPGGCFGDDGFDEGHPIRGIEITVRPGGGAEPIELGTVDADENFAFRLEAALPLLEPGRYPIEAQSDHGSSRTTLRVLP